MWYYNEEQGNFSVGSIPTKEVEGVIEEESGWVLIDTRPEPHDNYVFEGSSWIQKQVIKVVPQSLTPRQARLVLLQVGLLDEIEAMVATDRAMGIWWEYSLDVQRNNLHIVSAGLTLRLTSQQLDDLFILGATL